MRRGWVEEKLPLISLIWWTIDRTSLIFLVWCGLERRGKRGEDEMGARMNGTGSVKMFFKVCKSANLYVKLGGGIFFDEGVGECRK